MDTILSEKSGFNYIAPTVMHIDLNSCFASVEQQANPFLRGKPVAVAAYTSPGGCILAASREAKRMGVVTGLRVRDGKTLCPDLVVLPPDPNKYRFVNRQLLKLLRGYTDNLEVKSIDEMALNFVGAPSFRKRIEKYEEVFASNISENPKSQIPITKQILKSNNSIFAKAATGKQNLNCLEFGAWKLDVVWNLELGNWNFKDFKYYITVQVMKDIGQEIKNRIKTEVGEWLTVSIGISANRFLAKTASNLHKPDGLDVITKDNIESTLRSLKLEDLCGIKGGYGGRLRMCGIDTAMKFYEASIKDLRIAFASIVGYYWWLRLHGYEADDRQFERRSFGHSHALYVPYTTRDKKLHQILCQLTEKMGTRLRRAGYAAGGIHVACLFGHGFWHKGRKLKYPLYANTDLYKEALNILNLSENNPVKILSVSCFALTPYRNEQLDFFVDNTRKRNLTTAVDDINNRWGDLSVSSGRVLTGKRKVLDRISYGGVKDLEEFVFREPIELVSS